MENIYVFAGTIVSSLMLCTLLKIVSPNTNLSKVMSVVIGVFALICFISPIQNISADLSAQSTDFDLDEYSDEIENKYDAEVLKVTGEYINKYIYSLITSEIISIENITTSVAVNQNNGIYVREVCIYLTEEQSRHCEDIREIVVSAVNVEPKIMVIKGEE